MTPTELSSALRRIASRLATPGADPSAVRTAVAGLLERMDGRDPSDAAAKRIAAEMLRVAMDEIEVSLWDSDDGTAVDDAYKAARKQEEAEALETSLKLLRRKVDRFISEIRSPSQEPDDSGVVTSAPPVR